MSFQWPEDVLRYIILSIHVMFEDNQNRLKRRFLVTTGCCINPFMLAFRKWVFASVCRSQKWYIRHVRHIADPRDRIITWCYNDGKLIRELADCTERLVYDILRYYREHGNTVNHYAMKFQGLSWILEIKFSRVAPWHKSYTTSDMGS